MIRVQAEDFEAGAEIAALLADSPGAGGLCLFVGVVRDATDGAPVAAMTLEHYPGMTERELARLEAEARGRWPLTGVRIIHRHGRLAPGERIVLVAVASAHRAAAFEACRFLIDQLKTSAPFWKAEETPAGRRWVEARAEDDAAAQTWNAEDVDETLQRQDQLRRQAEIRSVRGALRWEGNLEESRLGRDDERDPPTG